MKTLKKILGAMAFRGHVSLRRKLFQGIQYIGGGSPEDIINRFGGYRVEYMEVIDNVLVIYVN